VLLRGLSFLSFSLDGKRNKKINDKRMAPPVCLASAQEEPDRLSFYYITEVEG
jgi:hypothetical protein